MEFKLREQQLKTELKARQEELKATISQGLQKKVKTDYHKFMKESKMDDVHFF